MDAHVLKEKKQLNMKEDKTEKQLPPDEEPKAPAPAKKKGNLGKRVVVGFALAAFSISLIIWGVLPFSIEVLVLAIFAMIEFYDMAERKGIRPSRSMGFTAVILLMGLAYWGKEEYMPALLLGLVMISMLVFLFRKGFHVSSFLDVGVTILGYLYVGWFFCYIILLRKIPGQPFNLLGYTIERGAGFVLLLIFSTSFTDIGAFFIGKKFGKHKLAPHISPNKTVQGTIGGFIGAVAGAFLIGSLLKISGSDLISIGLLCGMFAILGDLWESILKRDVRVKDAGSLIAGHGGVLDRIDSILFTTPMFYFYINYFYK